MTSNSEEIVRLTYFHGRGRAEQARWLLAATNVQFVNVCLDVPEQFEELKSKRELLFGQLPLLQIDGLKLVQSQAINRYIARRGKICGSTSSEEAKCDMIACAVQDAIGGIIAYPFRGLEHLKKGDENEAEKAGKEIALQYLERSFPRIERAIKEGKKKEAVFSVGTSLTYADVLVAAMAQGYQEALPGCLSDYPCIKSVRDYVVELPSVKRYIDSELYFPFPRKSVALEYATNVNKVLSR